MEEIHNSRRKLASGLSASVSLVVGTSIIHCAAMEEKGEWSLTKKKFWSMDMVLRLQSSISSTDASGMVVLVSKDLTMTSTVRS